MARSILNGLSTAQGMPLYKPFSGTTVSMPLTTVTNMDSRGGLAIPASVKPGTMIRATILVSATASAQTATVSARFGTANTNADSAIYQIALTAGAASAGFCQLLWNVYFLTSTTAYAGLQTVLSNTTNGFTGANQDLGPTTATTISTTSASFLGFYCSCSVGSVVTSQGVAYEVVAL